MSRWPLWRLLVWIEAWLLGVTVLHHYRPIHDAFVVPFLIAIMPAGVLVAIRSLARAATGQTTTPDARANVTELAISASAVVAAAWWLAQWALEAHADLQRIDAMLGRATIIVDVSLTGLALGACFAALILDWLLATAHAYLRGALKALRRTHIGVTVAHVTALFGSAWLFTNWPETAGDTSALFQRARVALHVYEYARATVFPMQALFAALAIAIVAMDSRTAE